MSDDNKPKLGTRPPLGLGKTVEVSKVKQSFSHGRTKQVVVEVKRQRVLHRPGDPVVETPVVVPEPVAVPVAAPAPAPAAPPRPEPVATPVAPAPAAAARPLPADTTARPVPPPVMFTPVERPVPVAKAPEPAPAPVVEAPAPAPAPVAVAPAPAPAPAPAASAAPVRSARATPRPAERRAVPTPPQAIPDMLTRQERQAALLRQAEEERMRLAEEARVREEAAKYEAAELEKMRLEDKKKAEAEAALRPAEERTPARPSSGLTPIIDDDGQPRQGQARRGCVPPAGWASATTVARAGSASRPRSRARTASASAAWPRSAAAREKERGSVSRTAKQVRDIVVPEMITVAELANRMAERTNSLTRLLARLGVPSAATDEIDQDTAELVVTEFGHNIVRVAESDADLDLVQAARGHRRSPAAAAAGGDDHGPCRPRQDIAARRAAGHQRRQGRGRRHHPAHRRLPDHDQGRRQDHLPRHAGPRGLHRRCAPAVPTSPTSSCWWWRGTTASCPRPSRRSPIPRRRACR